MKPVALTIAGSDPSGGAGLQADLKTFHQFGVYGASVVTLLTVQNTTRVSRVDFLDPAFVLDQLEAVLEDIPPAAAKSGALGDRAIVEAIANAARSFRFPLVVDPVMISKHGTPLMAEDAICVLRDSLLPLATLVTPNLAEAASLAGVVVRTLEDAHSAAEQIANQGVRAVLVKGGHFTGGATDLLYADGRFHTFPGDRIDTPHTHGTGCTYSAAITALLARQVPLVEAVGRAKAFIQQAIASSPGLGRGSGPVNHHAEAG